MFSLSIYPKKWYLVVLEPIFGLYKTLVSWMCLGFDQEASIPFFEKRKEKKSFFYTKRS